MRIHAEEEGACNAGAGAVFGHGLCDGENVILVERRLERRAAVTGRSERDALAGDSGIGLLRIVGGDEAGNVGEN